MKSDDADIHESEDSVLVTSDVEKYVFDKTEDGLEYNSDKSEPDYFPNDELLDRLADEVGMNVKDIFPLEFTMYAHDDSNTTEMLFSAGLPTEDHDLIDLFWNYPGEITIHGVIDDELHGYNFTPKYFEYEGKCFTKKFTPE